MAARESDTAPRIAAWIMVGGGAAMVAAGVLVGVDPRRATAWVTLMFAGIVALALAWMSRFMWALPPSTADSGGGATALPPVSIGILGVAAMLVAVVTGVGWARAPHVTGLWILLALTAGVVFAWRTWSAWSRSALPVSPRPLRLACYIGLQYAAMMGIGALIGGVWFTRTPWTTGVRALVVALIGGSYLVEPVRSGSRPARMAGVILLGLAALQILAFVLS